MLRPPLPRTPSNDLDVGRFGIEGWYIGPGLQLWLQAYMIEVWRDLHRNEVSSSEARVEASILAPDENQVGVDPIPQRHFGN